MNDLYGISPAVYHCGRTIRNKTKIPYTISSENCNVFIFVINGSAIHEVGGKSRLIVRGSVEIIPPFLHQVIRTCDDEDTEIFYLYFDLFEDKGAFLNSYKPDRSDVPLRELYFVDKPCHKNMESEYEKITQLIEKIENTYNENNKFADIERKSLMLELLIYFLYADSAEENTASMSVEGHVARAMRYIEKNCSDISLCTKSTAGYMGLNETYLSRLFERYVHMSLSKYIRTIRIERAKEMFFVNRKIGQVAKQCGFSSVQSFCRTFKMAEGITPGEYIKKI